MKVCNSCGRPMQHGHRFCPGCGARMDAASAAQTTPSAPGIRPTSPKRRPAVRPQFPPATIPERKQITALFADLCGSTAQVVHADPEDAEAYLDQALRLMSEAVEAYGGTVSQLLGDGLLALFGAPVAQEDHALRACLASIAIQHGGANRELRIRIGIDSGEVLISSASEFRSSHYRANGSTIHLASRLEQLAQPGTVLISTTTFRLVEGQIDATSLGKHTVRGSSNEIEVYQLTLASDTTAAVPLAGRRASHILIGRSEVLAELDAIAQQVRGGRLRVVGLRGEAGVGKSRILAEFMSGSAAHAFNTCSITARPYASHVPYGVIADLIRELMGAPRRLFPHHDRTATRALVDAWPDSGRKHVAAAIDLLELGDPGKEWLSLTPTQRRRRIGEALQWQITECIVAAPLLIVIEDLSAADRDSLRILEALAARLAVAPVLVCTTYRQDFEHRLAEGPWFIEKWIGPLPAGDMLQLARAIFGEHESLATVVSELVERADGNPFFLEQLAMALVDDGSLMGLPGALRRARPRTDIRVPGSISTVIAARVDRLPPAAKASVEAAAVLGEPITGELIGSMQGLGAGNAERHLSLAASTGLMNAGTRNATTTYEFCHALVRDAVAAALTRSRRKLLHRAAFTVLKSYLGEQSADHASMLAHHAYSGEAWAEAAEFALKSIARAIARSANRDALRMFELGLDAVPRIETPSVGLPLELGLRMDALGALLPLGQFDAIVANLERAEVITKLIRDSRKQAAVQVQLAVMRWARGDYRGGLAVAADAERAAIAAGSRSLQMAAAHARMMLNHGLGRYRQAAEDAREVERLFKPEMAARRLVPGWAVIAAVNVPVFLASALCYLGDLAAAQAACDRAYRELEEQDHAYSRVLVDFVQGSLWMTQRRFGKTVALLEAAVASCKTNDVPTMYPAVVALLGGAMARGGRIGEAVALLERAIADKVYLAGGRYTEFYLRLNLGVALAAADRHDDALASITAARACAAASEERGHEAEAWYEMAAVHLAAGHRQLARTCFGEARAIAAECSMAPVASGAQAGIEQIDADLRYADERACLRDPAASDGI